MLFVRIVFLILALALVLMVPDIKTRIENQRGDRRISLTVDWGDVIWFSQKEEKSLPLVLDRLLQIPISIIAVPLTLTEKEETHLRGRGFQLLWRGEQEANPPYTLFTRLKEGDGILSQGETVFGYPKALAETAEAVKQKKGFFPLMEFSPQVGLHLFSPLVKNHLIKGHCLQTKEMMTPYPQLWKHRLRRAVEERWVRFLYIHFSPALPLEENLAFQSDVMQDLIMRKYEFGPPRPFPHWETNSFLRSLSQGQRLLMASLLGLFGPVLGFVLILSFSRQSPLLRYIFFSFFSIGIGVAIYGLGSSWEAALGFAKVKGIKILLILPLLISLCFLLTKKEWEQILTRPLTGAHVLIGGVLGAGFIGLYLMRSGNFPLLSVTHVERLFRDLLEEILGVRPRFKEFFIGHPLLLLGFLIQGRVREKKSFLTDGRLWLWLGLIGQISIINTFLHFHSPFHVNMARTLHGLWLGVLFSIPLCVIYSKQVSRDRKG